MSIHPEQADCEAVTSAFVNMLEYEVLEERYFCEGVSKLEVVTREKRPQADEESLA